jgi:hypothetical protein
VFVQSSDDLGVRVDVSVVIAGDGAGDELRSLRAWLVEEDELRGRVRLRQRPPEPDELGAVDDVLIVALGPGGVATVLASVLITWIRHRTGDVTVKLTRPDGTSVDVTAKHVRGLAAADVQTLTTELSRSLDAGGGDIHNGQ